MSCHILDARYACLEVQRKADSDTVPTTEELMLLNEGTLQALQLGRERATAGRTVTACRRAFCVPEAHVRAAAGSDLVVRTYVSR